MPELPEVETVRRGLLAHVRGRRIGAVRVYHDRAVRRHLGGAADFQSVLAGRLVRDVRRRGKYLWWALDGGDAVLAHLGMSGQFRVSGSTPDVGHPHLRIRFVFDDGGPDLDFLDQRTFGGMTYAPGGAELPAAIAHIAHDPLDPAFDPAAAVAAVRRRHTGIKRALLDQTVVSGVGNIYADETLWRAELHFERPTDRLTRAKATEVLDAATDVMTEALAAGGTSFDALYVDVNGESGLFHIDVERVEGSLTVKGGDWLCRTSAKRQRVISQSDQVRRALSKPLYGPACSATPRRRAGLRSLRGVACA